MKTGKTLGFVAVALAALAGTAPLTSQAAGDIMYIETYPNNAAVDPGSKDNPLVANQEFQIRVRLLNRNFIDVYSGTASTAAAPQFTLKYVGANSEELSQFYLPKLGLWVGNKKVLADLVELPHPAPLDDATNPDKYYFTDMVFKYTVKCGDLALPVRLLNSSGTGPVDVTDTSDSGPFWLENAREGDDWLLCWTNDTASACQFNMLSTESIRNSTSPALAGTILGELGYDNKATIDGQLVRPGSTWDFSTPMVFIQGIDFDANYVNEETGVWREISEGTTSTSTIGPQLSIFGGAADNRELYIWTEDPSVIKVEAGGRMSVAADSNVGKIKIITNDENVPFSLRAVGAAGTSTYVYLSDSPTNVVNAAGDVVNNLIKRKVTVVQPPPPFLQVSLAQGAEKTITADGDFSTPKTVLKVSLSQAYTADLDIFLTPTLPSYYTGGDPADDVWKYIGMSLNDAEDSFNDRSMRVTIRAGQTEAAVSDTFKIFAKGADMWTQALTNGITFKASVQDTAAQSWLDPTRAVDAKIFIKVSKPVVTVPDAPYTDGNSLQNNIEQIIPITIADSFYNQTAAYTVYLQESGSSFQGSLCHTYTNLVPTSDGKLMVPAKYISTGLMTSYIKVKNSQDVESDAVSFQVNVKAPRELGGVPADGNTLKLYGEGGEASIRAVFSPEAFTLANEAFVFLEPQDEISSNLVESVNFQRGVRIQNGQTEAAVPLKLQLLDGTVASETTGLRFKLRLRTAETWDAGNDLDGYASRDYDLYVTNVVPSVETVYMGGIWNVGNGGTMEGSAAVGVSKEFTLDPVGNEVDADLDAGCDENGVVTNQAAAFVAKWTFFDGAGFTTNVYGNPYNGSVSYSFINGGKQKVTVELQDKDLRQTGANKFGPKFTFYVNVIEAPAVMLSTKSGLTQFQESQYGSDLGVVNVDLTMAPADPVDVQITISRAGSAGSNPDLYYPLPELSSYTVHFPKGQTSGSFYLKTIDGTELGADPGYIITASVTNDTVNSDGVKYKDLYRPVESFPIYIINQKPTISSPSPADTNIYITTLAKQEQIRWKVSDACKADIAAGLTITIMNDEGAFSQFTTYETSGTYTNVFKSQGGGKWVSIQVTDKDDDTPDLVVKKYFEITASKGLYLYPQAPFAGGGQSRLTQAYCTAAGLGCGRVWAESDSTPTILGFRQVWGYAKGSSTAVVHGYGYHVGDVDDGDLNSSMGRAITSAGTVYTAGSTPYTYTNSKYDSFLYAWVVDAAEEGASVFTGTATIKPTSGNTVSEQLVGLPEDEDDAESYPDTVLEAIFSREYFTTDNVGDINQDGIPDTYASRAYNAGTLYSLAAAAKSAGEGGGAGESDIDTSDLTDAAGYNGDLDTVPAAFNYGAIKPSVPGWGPGEDFKAYWEIRGFHDGLNESYSDPDFSDAEKMALLCDYAKSGADVSGDYDTVLGAATNWAKRTSWNCECRTDPTMADTDQDGFEDGWEYFFWYYAKAGEIVNGEWKRLTGSRFNIATPGRGTPIPSEQIVAAFNPLVKRPSVQSASLGWDVKDFDGDGLTDLEEFALGTNPVDWDSDGDGVSDYFEVINGLDPLNPEDGGFGNVSAKANPDGDFMAYKESDDYWTVVKVLDADGNERVFGYPVLDGGIDIVSAEGGEEGGEGEDGEAGDTTGDDGAATSEDVWAVAVGADKVPYFLKDEPLLVAGFNGTDKYLANDATAWTAIVIGEGEDQQFFLGAETKLEAGAMIAECADAAASVPHAVTSGFTEGLELFRYGSDDQGIWVPRSVDGQTMFAEYDDMGMPVEQTFQVLAYESSVKIAYIHSQVYYKFGFDPRTGWNMDSAGYVAARWHVKDSESDGGEGDTGLAVNTRPYNSYDEMLLLAYRYNVNAVTNDVGKFIPFRASRSLKDDLGSVANHSKTVADILIAGTTKATPDGYVAPSKAEEEAEGEGSAVVVATLDTDVHGADTDGDGIPDGWELYVNMEPKSPVTGLPDAQMIDDPLGLWDKDGLVQVQEFAGTDSCNAYSNVPSIYQNHPGVVKGWWNKFFPTDPMDADTDGDGLSDAAEGNGAKGVFYVGRSVYTGVDMSFIYNQEESLEKFQNDFSTKCFRGGGLNPCTVDTDLDLLPDPFEYEFAGVVFGTDMQPKTAAISKGDILSMQLSDGVYGRSAVNGEYIAGGMDGTWNGDAYGVRVKDGWLGDDVYRDTDWDHDGLQNYQEYLVQTLRHLRYDDSETPLMGHYLVWGTAGIEPVQPSIGFIPMQCWDGEAFRQTCLDAGYAGTSPFDFAQIGYFARPPKKWDRLAQNVGGKNRCANYDEAGYRVMLRPQALAPETVYDPFSGELMYVRYVASGYACTDPRQWDSDNDGMDDYYEIFHGLNPLLGSSVNPSAGSLATSAGSWGTSNDEYDRIALIYGGRVTSWNNAWTMWDAQLFAQPGVSKFDAIKYPWMIGTAECDADGDGINNADESIFVNDTNPASAHTDPTPLWMTDSTSANNASFVAQYYQMDPSLGALADLNKLWDRNTIWVDKASDGQTRMYKFAFEENEGFDTDGDFVNDAAEKTKTVQAASDALVYRDPDHRQAMWFPGDKSALVSYKGSQLRPNSYEFDMLKQFTVEVWVRPESRGTDQVILERVAFYDGSTLSNNVALLRRNFRLGIDETGHPYGMFEGKTADSVIAKVVSEAEIPMNEWTHLALSFNGSDLSLYVNDSAAPIAKASGIQVIPANGVNVRLQDSGTSGGLDFTRLENGYSTVPCAFIVGAAARNEAAINLNQDTTWSAYGAFFTGYIDEVRVWDGARVGDDIKADYMKRYTMADIATQRNDIFDAWFNGARRYGSAEMQLEPELLQVYDFSSLPSAVETSDIITAPRGFTKGVLDNVRSNGRRVDLQVGWWSQLPVKSTVYRNYSLVPRIQNAVGHLPVFDGSCWDSEYWSESFGGVNPASQSGYSKFEFPNAANPYSFWNFCQERIYHLQRLSYLCNGLTLPESASKAYYKYEFDMRSGFVGTSDLVPLGGAFAKRIAEYWDGQGASTAWEQTKTDSDNDDLPDWWEKYAKDNYGAPADLTWSTIITYDGLQLTAAEAYLRDLAKGMMPGGAVDQAFSMMGVDADHDGMPDWWETVYGINSQDPLDDADNDQLSNYAEYLIGECFTSFNFPRVQPTKGKTFFGEGQAVPDYFLPVGKLYLGEMFADHDMIEDWWEDLYDVKYASRFTFDAESDADEDGWSVFSEARAGTNPNRIAYLGVDELTVADHPVPVVEMTVKYNGTQAVAGKDVIVKAYRMDEPFGQPDAVWHIESAQTSSSAATSTSSKESTANSAKLIGLNPCKSIDLTLGPGSVVVGSVSVNFKDIAFDRVQSYVYMGVESVVNTLFGKAEDAVWLSGVVDQARPGDTVWGDLVQVTYERTSESNSVGKVKQVVGSINYQTGAATIELQKLTGRATLVGEATVINVDALGGQTVEYNVYSLSNSYVKVMWTSKQTDQGLPQTYYLSDAENPLAYQSRGYLREGKNMFVAFIDVDGDGLWTAGEPYGVVSDVDVGWSRVAPFCVEMTDTFASMARINLTAAEGEADFAAVNAMTDRGVRGSYYPNFAAYFSGTNVPLKAATRVRLVRTTVNGQAKLNNVSYSEVLFDETYDLDVHSDLTEADIRAKGMIDLDWGTLAEAWARTHTGAGARVLTALTNVAYRVVLGNETVDPDEMNNNLPVLFVNAFEYGTAQTKALPVNPRGTVYAGQPTFSWKHDAIDGNGNRVKYYPAFRLRVWKDAAKSSLVYDSGNQPAPARDSDGVYTWTAPIYAEMPTPQGVMFATTNNYFWTVSMLDAKFTTPNNNETAQEFRMETSGKLGTISDYGTIQAKVKYFGPGSVSTAVATANGRLMVEAYSTPDFSGMPVGSGWVNNTASLANTDMMEVNAVILGVPPGTYYVRAFIDTNGNQQRDAWESWGYANYVGGESRNVYAPQPYTLRKGQANETVAEVFIEDMDTDNDGLPDVYEMENGGLDAKSSPIGATFFTKVNPQLATQVETYTTLGGRTASTAPKFAAMTFMAALSSSNPEAVSAAAALLGTAPAAKSNGDEVTVKIESFSMADGVKIAVGASVDAAATAGGLLTVSDHATVGVYLVASDKVDFSNAKSVKVKDIEVQANGESNVTVTAEELRKVIEDNGLGGSAFLKVKLAQ